MKKVLAVLALAVAVASLGLWSLGRPARAQETPRAGGELAYSVLAEPPSFDAHQEATFAVPHTTAPFYSLLVKFDPFEYPKIVPERYYFTEYVLRSGERIQGKEIYSSREALLAVTREGRYRRIDPAEIAGQTPQALSLMPTGLLSGLTPAQVADLIAYLKSG